MPTEQDIQKAVETLREAGVCVVMNAKVYGWVERRDGVPGPAFLYDNEFVGVKVEVVKEEAAAG